MKRMRPGSREWTDTEVSQLEALRAKGMSYTEIAKVLGRTMWSVQSKGSNLGLTNPVSEFEAAQALVPQVDRSKMSLTALMLGDPPPGRSALDQGASA
jgi:hypothetical protein